MAEEIVLNTPEATQSDGGNLRRNSTGDRNSSNNGGKILPHYLRASTGSCHDFCKYGKKHGFETEARLPIRKRITPPPPTPTHDGQNSAEILVLADRKTTSSVKLKLSSDSKTLFSESPKIIELNVSSPSKNFDTSSKQEWSNTKQTSSATKLASSFKPKSTTVKSVWTPKPPIEKPVSSPISSADSSGRRNSNSNNAGRSNASTKRVISLNSKPATAKSSSSDKALGGSIGKRESNVKTGKKTRASQVAVKKVLIPPTASLSPKPSLSNVTSLNGRKRRSLKIVPPLQNQNRIEKVEAEQRTVKKVLIPPTASSSPRPSLSRGASLNGRKHRSLKIAPPLKNQNIIGKVEAEQPNEENVQEKTLHVIKLETQNKTFLSVENGSPIEIKTVEPVENGLSTLKSSPSSLLSPHSSSSPTSLSSFEEEDQEESEYTDGEIDDVILDENESLNVEKAENMKGDYKRSPGKNGKVLSEDEDGTAVKLSFRRGKVVELQSETNGPRRLRFRRGRVLGENQNVKGEARRKSFKRRERVDGDTDGANLGSGKVVLRHQDGQEKKDAQGLFNNVIEETANKLVETRKSKVKALVGAFETVISLQDGKQSTNTVQ